MKKRIFAFFIIAVIFCVGMTGFVACNKKGFDINQFYGTYVQDKFGSATLYIDRIDEENSAAFDYMVGIIPQFVGFTEDGFHKFVDATLDEHRDIGYFVNTERGLQIAPEVRAYIDNRMEFINQGILCDESGIRFVASDTVIESPNYGYYSDGKSGETLECVCNNFGGYGDDVTISWFYRDELFGVDAESKIKTCNISFTADVSGQNDALYRVRIEIYLHRA